MEERDLSFKLVVNDKPAKLTRDQIDSYNEIGYIKPLNVFSDKEAVQNRDYFDSLLDQMKHDDGSYAINGFQIRCRGIWDLATDSRILDYVEDLIGPNIIAWGTHFFCKQPHDPKIVPWHQDASYWPLSPARTVTAWLAIDDADVENAAMQFIPGTHRHGPLSWKETTKPAVLSQEIENIGSYGPAVSDCLRAGQMSLHADMLAHGSTSNESDRRRCGLTIRYCPPDVQPLNPNWGKQSILCRGVDPTGRWSNTPRPAGDDVSVMDKPASIGAN